MHKDYNMTQLTLPLETSVLIPTNDIVETIPETEFDDFICPNNQRPGFKRYAYRHDKYGFKRDFKINKCDDCSECPLKHHCINFNSKTNKKIMKNYNWEYFLRPKLIKSFQNQKQKPYTVKEKLMWILFLDL